MLTTHPDTIRPDHSGHGFVPGAGFPVESEGVALRLATVILRQAGDGQPTSIEHFREASETRDLSSDDIARNIGRARQLADQKVIRQDDPTFGAEAGQVHGMREATDEDDLAEATDEQLLDIATGACADIVTDDAIVGHLLQRGLRPAAISRIWSRLTVRLAAGVAQLDKPSIGALAKAARVA